MHYNPVESSPFPATTGSQPVVTSVFPLSPQPTSSRLPMCWHILVLSIWPLEALKLRHQKAPLPWNHRTWQIVQEPTPFIYATLEQSWVYKRWSCGSEWPSVELTTWQTIIEVGGKTASEKWKRCFYIVEENSYIHLTRTVISEVSDTNAGKNKL